MNITLSFWGVGERQGGPELSSDPELTTNESSNVRHSTHQVHSFTAENTWCSEESVVRAPHVQIINMSHQTSAQKVLSMREKDSSSKGEAVGSDFDCFVHWELMVVNPANYVQFNTSSSWGWYLIGT